MSIKITMLLILIGLSNTAMAQTYAGAAGGISAVDASGYKIGFTQTVFVGLRYQDSGLELSVHNLGDFTATNGSGTVKAAGVSIAVMPYFPLNKTFELFGKVGGMAWNLNRPAGNLSFINSDGFSYLLGLGANVNIFRHFTMRLELQKYYQIGATSDGRAGSAISTITAGTVFVF